MPENEMPDDADRSLSANATATATPDTIVKEYLLKHVAVFRELMELKRKVSLCETYHSQLVKQSAKCLQGWENPKGDEHFKKQRIRADHADRSGQRIFYNMMCQIGDELHNSTKALSLSSACGIPPSVLAFSRMTYQTVGCFVTGTTQKLR